MFSVLTYILRRNEARISVPTKASVTFMNKTPGVETVTLKYYSLNSMRHYVQTFYTFSSGLFCVLYFSLFHLFCQFICFYLFALFTLSCSFYLFVFFSSLLFSLCHIFCVLSFTHKLFYYFKEQKWSTVIFLCVEEIYLFIPVLYHVFWMFLLITP